MKLKTIYSKRFAVGLLSFLASFNDKELNEFSSVLGEVLLMRYDMYQKNSFSTLCQKFDLDKNKRRRRQKPKGDDEVNNVFDGVIFL